MTKKKRPSEPTYTPPEAADPFHQVEHYKDGPDSTVRLRGEKYWQLGETNKRQSDFQVEHDLGPQSRQAFHDRMMKKQAHMDRRAGRPMLEPNRVRVKGETRNGQTIFSSDDGNKRRKHEPDLHRKHRKDHQHKP